MTGTATGPCVCRCKKRWRGAVVPRAAQQPEPDGPKKRRYREREARKARDGRLVCSPSHAWPTEWHKRTLLVCVACPDGSTTSVTLAATDSAATSAYNGQNIYFNSGTGSGQGSTISSYDSSTKIATLTDTLTTAVASGTGYSINGGAAGNLCHVDCSNKGQCDHGSGECTCYEGFYGINCANKQTQM